MERPCVRRKEGFGAGDEAQALILLSTHHYRQLRAFLLMCLVV